MSYIAYNLVFCILTMIIECGSFCEVAILFELYPLVSCSLARNVLYQGVLILHVISLLRSNYYLTTAFYYLLFYCFLNLVLYGFKFTNKDI